MKLIFSILAVLLAESSSYSLNRAHTSKSFTKLASTKIDILSREIDLTDTLKIRVDSKIGKVSICLFLLNRNIANCPK